MPTGLVTLSVEERRRLLWWARRAIASAARDELLEMRRADGALARPAAAFVSLHRDGLLRGCMGSVTASATLLDAVVTAAAAAANDPRFEPVGVGELDTLVVQISVLGAIERVATVRQIELGVHGVILEHEGRQGLFLPQVALEQGWDHETLLHQICVKAGMGHGAPPAAARLFRFRADVIDE